MMSNEYLGVICELRNYYLSSFKDMTFPDLTLHENLGMENISFISMSFEEIKSMIIGLRYGPK